MTITIIKKLFYGAENLKIRDVIDVAVVCREKGNELKQYYPLICSKINLLEHRWGKLRLKYFEEVNQLKVFERTLVEQAPILFEQFLRDLNKAKLFNQFNSRESTTSRL
ncbi:hypothetical protein B0S90_2329 [Caldicellulosiruptor bescii]|uniref:Uncharacterized protein n=1 Tax=Caldicellulosiruptor bescii (strain ATCC BAA-1888 / DSM 6725 / KCTC 15123 / Z-1320) TaxID=521460 RepID=B9MLA2_CALBD|nr:hypothetical protein [Caldicellulosiruptor bescii]ACM61092.1 hypothetical protein Athe_2007 [Caldicellulosiruptor bescii DSM 6725]PBC89094.1 hypothetical protein B0S87_2161 [Caldicellulosiruptor bescii]PBC91424.1 hypothetical protein B0S89_1831 [Caldicellulosiruptor bescii]PBD07222.1 hypothetical protein B0S90_2329 [Caldicellulosiruptor bescii]PBD09788.1 hypothetical protein B0S84_2246 [Caldicellulosiruptor bescii]